MLGQLPSPSSMPSRSLPISSRLGIHPVVPYRGRYAWLGDPSVGHATRAYLLTKRMPNSNSACRYDTNDLRAKMHHTPTNTEINHATAKKARCQVPGCPKDSCPRDARNSVVLQMRST